MLHFTPLRADSSFSDEKEQKSLAVPPANPEWFPRWPKMQKLAFQQKALPTHFSVTTAFRKSQNLVVAHTAYIF
jgi:hypothetical protein